MSCVVVGHNYNYTIIKCNI